MPTDRPDPDALLRALSWRCIGPFRGGRVVAVAGDPVDPAVFYFGACAGGVWKTSDAGTYWENVSDGFFETAAVGAVATGGLFPARSGIYLPGSLGWIQLQFPDRCELLHLCSGEEFLRFPPVALRGASRPRGKVLPQYCGGHENCR